MMTKKTIKIYHGPQNIGGMAGLLAKAQRSLGANAYASVYENKTYHFHTDSEISGNKIQKSLQLLRLLGKSIFDTDIFHFYFGNSLTGPLLWDIPLLKKLGKKVFLYFCGCDIRDKSITIQKYEYSACKECWPQGCSRNREKAIQIATEYADKVFVSTPDLLEFIPGSIWLPQPIDVEKIQNNSFPTPILDQNKIYLAHAPSNRSIKGTHYIEKCLIELQNQGYQLELILIENSSHEEALRKTASADIVIDQLLIGSYGQYSLEAMALGKPVICYLREDLLPFYPSQLPIISANPKTLSDVIVNLIKQKNNWKEIGKKGRQYVKEVHDCYKIAKVTLEYYLNLLKLSN